MKDHGMNFDRYEPPDDWSGDWDDHRPRDYFGPVEPPQRPPHLWQGVALGLVVSFPFWLFVGVAVWLALGGAL